MAGSAPRPIPPVPACAPRRPPRISTATCSMLLVTIILLNLLIAVIGDAYDRVTKDRHIYAIRAKAEMIVETDMLLPAWLREKRDKAFLRGRRLVVVQVREAEGGGTPTMHGAAAGCGSSRVVLRLRCCRCTLLCVHGNV